jgi:hypothetical protein
MWNETAFLANRRQFTYGWLQATQISITEIQEKRQLRRRLRGKSEQTRTKKTLHEMEKNPKEQISHQFGEKLDRTKSRSTYRERMYE